MTESYVNRLLSEIEVTGSETPAQLRDRAEALKSDYAEALQVPVRIGDEMAALRGLAAAVERRDAALAPLADAEARVAEAEAAFAATAEPEQEAARRCTAARHAFEGARDQLAQAQQAGEEPAALIELDVRATSAARVDAHEQQKLADAQAAREGARQAMEAAREAARTARAELDDAEAQVASPLSGERDIADRMEALVFTWPLRVTKRHEPGMELDPVDWQICRELCQHYATVLSVMPVGLARDIRETAQRDAVKGIRQMQIVMPGGRQATVGAVLDQAL